MKKIKLPDDFIERGCFVVPHFIFSEDTRLDKHQRLLLVLLFALEDRTRKKRQDDWVFISNQSVSRCTGISERRLPAIRDRICLNGLLHFKRGRKGRATSYRLLLDKFYRIWKTDGGKTVLP